MLVTKRILKRKHMCTIFLAGMLLLALGACGKAGTETEETADTESSSAGIVERIDTGYIVTTPDSFDSADTAILVATDKEEKTLTFLNLDVGKKYTLTMDGTTCFYDRYGEGIAYGQVQVGDIVDVTFLKSKKHLTTLTLSKAAWKQEQVERYEMNPVRGEISIGSDVYKLTSNTRYISGDREIDIRDINGADVLSFQGIDSQILSVKVEKGHGYLRLTNDENFVGGWIEIGQSMVRRIEEDMLLLVPEGSYKVTISNKGGGGTKSAVINRNEETILDIGDLTIPEPQYGMVLFSLDPSKAELYIDGSAVDASSPIKLLYGLHQLIARAEGYQSITQYFKVGQESAGINVVLDPNTNKEEDETVSSGSSSSESVDNTVTNYYKVYIDAPTGVEVYLDGNYVGISPCSFKKTAGSHVITLRQTGYETRSYTIQVEEDEKDLSMSFADLIKLQESNESKEASKSDSTKESSSGENNP